MCITLYTFSCYSANIIIAILSASHRYHKEKTRVNPQKYHSGLTSLLLREHHDLTVQFIRL